jgi:hypothetical protein
MEIIYTNKMPRPIVTTDADDAKIFSELYIPHEFTFSGGTPLALNMSFLSADSDKEAPSVAPYSASVVSSANGSAALNTTRSVHSSPVTHKHFARILLDANYRIVRIDKCFVQGLPVYRVHYYNDVDFDMEEEGRIEIQYIFPNEKLRKQCSVSSQNPFRSDATRNNATRSDATRSNATRSNATRSDATRSDATRSDATRSSATRSKQKAKRKKSGNETPRTPRKNKKRRRKNSSASKTPKTSK